jgi:protocadherin Fat 1/2/3
MFQLVDGKIQYRFDCGSGEGLARAGSVAVNDGYWHSVAVERNSRTVHIIIDGKLSGEGSAPGTNDVLNLDSNDVFFGAEVRLLAHDLEDIRNGFIGCMNNVKLDGIELPLSGSASVAVLQNINNIEFHCHGTYTPGTSISHIFINCLIKFLISQVSAAAVHV